MKVFYFLSFLIFVVSCSPVSLDEISNKRDGAKGENTFDPSTAFEELGTDEVLSNINSNNCSDYENYSSFSILGEYSITQDIQNCMAYTVDEGLAPLCKRERVLKDALKYYEDKNDDDKVAEIKILLEDIEEQKYDMADTLYAMADSFYQLEDTCNEFFKKDSNASDLEQVIAPLGNLLCNSEIGGLTRVLDSRTRIACGDQIDLSEVTSRRQ